MSRKTEVELRRMAEEIVGAIEQLKTTLPSTVGRKNAIPLALACLKVAVEATEFAIAYDESMKEN